jgi:hypothetical protein
VTKVEEPLASRVLMMWKIVVLLPAPRQWRKGPRSADTAVVHVRLLEVLMDNLVMSK